MNLNGEELTKVSDTLLEILKDEVIVVPLDQLLSQIKIPDLGGLIQSFQQLLPQNLIQFAVDGIPTLLNPTQLQQAIAQGIDAVKGLVESQITTALNNALGNLNQSTNQAQEVASGFVNAANQISSGNSNVIGGIIDTSISIGNITGQDTSSIALVSGAIAPILEEIQNLSPREIRDLQNPQAFQQYVSQAVETAGELIGNEAVKNAASSIEPSLNIATIGNLFKIGVDFFGSLGPGLGNGEEYEELVEIRTYYAKGEGADVDASKYKSVTGKRLQPGRSCAVDNARILFDSSVATSVGTFTAVDKVKTPSSTGIPVVSLFFDDQETASQIDLQLSQSKKSKQIVKVRPPGITFQPKKIEVRGQEYNIF